MSCKSGGTSCRLSGRFSSDDLYFWCSGRGNGDFKFWIASGDCRVSFCFRSLYTADILWKYIQGRIGSLYLSFHNCTIMVGKVVCLVYMEVIIVVLLGYSVLEVDLSGAGKNKMGAFRFLD